MNGPASSHSPARRAIASVLCGLLAAPPALFAAPAFAAGEPPAPAVPGAARPKLAVVAVSLDQNDVVAERLGQVAERVVARTGRQELASLAALLDPAGAEARRVKAEEGRAEYEQARRFYDELEVQKAADHCDRALAAFERSDLTATFDELVKSWMFRIAALIANAENRTANVELNLLLPIDLRTAFDPATFAPDFIAQVRKRRGDLKNKANLGFDLQTRPVPARVFIDGAFSGVTPLEVRGLPPGDHYVTLVAPGYQLVQKRFKAGVGQTFLETLPGAERLPLLQTTLAKLRRDFRGPGRNVAGRELAQNLGVDQVLIVGVTARDKDSLQVVAVRLAAADGHELSYIDEPLPVDEVRFGAAAEDLLGRVVGSDVGRKGGKALSTTGGGFQWRARHTGYVLAGVGLAALASGVYFGLDANDLEKQYRIREDAQTNPIYDSLEKDGRRSALYADLSFVAALILGGTGLFLAITGRGTGEAEEANPNIDERSTVIRATRVEEPLEAPVAAPVSEAPRPAPEPAKKKGSQPAAKRQPPAAEPGPSKRSEPAPTPAAAEEKPEPAPAVAPPKKPEAQPAAAEPKPAEPKKIEKPADKPAEKPKKPSRDEEYHDDLRDD